MAREAGEWLERERSISGGEGHAGGSVKRNGGGGAISSAVAGGSWPARERRPSMAEAYGREGSGGGSGGSGGSGDAREASEPEVLEAALEDGLE